MAYAARNYEDLLRHVRKKGKFKPDRTSVGTFATFGGQFDCSLRGAKAPAEDGSQVVGKIPVIQTKKINFHAVVVELLWFLRGDTNIRYLLEYGVHIWTEWPFVDYLKRTNREIPEQDTPEWKQQIKEFERQILEDEAFATLYGDMGPIYGRQWRTWPKPDGTSVDQLQRVMDQLSDAAKMHSRRLVISAWNPGELDDMLLEPCHATFQFDVIEGELYCKLYQRSADMFLGVPFNIASYALLTHLIAFQLGLKVAEFVWSGGDVHLYTNHVDQADEQLSRKRRPAPKLRIKRRRETIFDYEPDDFELVGYDSPDPWIKAPIAV